MVDCGSAWWCNKCTDLLMVAQRLWRGVGGDDVLSLVVWICSGGGSAGMGCRQW